MNRMYYENAMNAASFIISLTRGGVRTRNGDGIKSIRQQFASWAPCDVLTGTSRNGNQRRYNSRLRCTFSATQQDCINTKNDWLFVSPEHHRQVGSLPRSAGQVHLWKTSLACLRQQYGDDLSFWTHLENSLSLPDQVYTASISTRLIRKQQFLLSRTFISEILRAYHIAHPELGKHAHGKPYLIHHPEFKFNLSHCGDGDQLVVAITWGLDSDIGVDMEYTDRYCNKLEVVSKMASKYFGREELELLRELLSKDGQSVSEMFLYLWTMKESLCKCTGQGIQQEVFRAARPVNGKPSGFGIGFGKDKVNILRGRDALMRVDRPQLVHWQGDEFKQYTSIAVGFPRDRDDDRCGQDQTRMIQISLGSQDHIEKEERMDTGVDHSAIRSSSYLIVSATLSWQQSMDRMGQ